MSPGNSTVNAIAAWSSWVSYSLPLHIIPCKLPQKLPHLFSCTLCVFPEFLWSMAELGHCCPGPAQVPSAAVTCAVVFCQVSGFPGDSLSSGILWNAPLTIVLALELLVLATEFSFCFFHFSPFICFICCQNTKFLPILSISTSSRGSLMKNGRIKTICIFNPVHPIDSTVLWGTYKSDFLSKSWKWNVEDYWHAAVYLNDFIIKEYLSSSNN